MSELKTIRKIIGGIVRATNSTKTMNKIADYLLEEIPQRTRSGFGVASKGKSKRRFKDLAPVTVERRRNDPDLNRGLTTPSKSNLTRTGKMVDSIKKDVREGRATVKLSRPQATKAKKNLVLGRRFMEVSDKDLEEIEDIITKAIEAEINKLK